MKQTTQLLNKCVRVNPKEVIEINEAIIDAEKKFQIATTQTIPSNSGGIGTTTTDPAIERNPIDGTAKWADSMHQVEVDKLYGSYNKQAKEPGKETLVRADFKKILIKGVNKFYWSFKSMTLELEVCLEPCLGGFCIAIYENKFSGVPVEPELKEKKVCTNIELPEKMFRKELIEGTQERSEETWEKGLKIANNFWRKHKNNKKLKEWGMIKGDQQGIVMGATASGYMQTGFMQIIDPIVSPDSNDHA